MGEEFADVYLKLEAWCRARGYAGHDPFDALNSRLFRMTPLRRSRLARLAWTQALKRSPVNLRRLLLVPVGVNAKGTALFALAALSRVRAGAGADYGTEARKLLGSLLAARIEAPGGRAWGYNFDWQGRAFYAPQGTPTVVPTAFAVRALVEAAAAFNEPGTAAATVHAGGVRAGGGEYLGAAREACEFVLRGLNRSEEGDDEVCFSYTPLDQTRVFNASLLAGEALAAVGQCTGERELLDAARRAARHVVARQRADGSWAYGADSYQGWADNFHTAFVLTSLARVRRSLLAAGALGPGDEEGFDEALRRGYRFWREGFFLADGWPRYYHDRSYPADAHSAGAALVAFAELGGDEPEAVSAARLVAGWAVRHLFDSRGFFYYQRRRLYTARTPYMRWSQAWMLYGLARMMEEGEKGKRERG
ncbi:MAG TPA: hypothetical protein VEY09_13385 [Pyrinomonadaceae bacterium]|nr:hypothetical protein [Pyrinomonadaceae bacterium]